jgi:hypothetical protein
MKKNGFLLFIVVLLFSCKKISEREILAFEKANYLVQNFSNVENAIQKFPVKYFEKQKVADVLYFLNNECEIGSNEVVFLRNHYTYNINSNDVVKYIYHSNLKCGKFYIILSYELSEDPQLFNLKLEPIKEVDSI